MLQRAFRNWMKRGKLYVSVLRYMSHDASKDGRNRARAYKEIYTTELSYMTSLQTLITAFMIPMQVWEKGGGRREEGGEGERKRVNFPL